MVSFKEEAPKPTTFKHIDWNREKIFGKKAPKTHPPPKCQASEGTARASCLGNTAVRRLIIKPKICMETLLWPENVADCSEIPPSLAEKNMLNLTITSKSFHYRWTLRMRKRAERGCEGGQARTPGFEPRCVRKQERKLWSGLPTLGLRMHCPFPQASSWRMNFSIAEIQFYDFTNCNFKTSFLP